MKDTTEDLINRIKEKEKETELLFKDFNNQKISKDIFIKECVGLLKESREVMMRDSLVKLRTNENISFCENCLFNFRNLKCKKDYSIELNKVNKCAYRTLDFDLDFQYDDCITHQYRCVARLKNGEKIKDTFILKSDVLKVIKSEKKYMDSHGNYDDNIYDLIIESYERNK